MRLPFLRSKPAALPASTAADALAIHPVLGGGLSDYGFSGTGALGILGGALPGSDRDWVAEVKDPTLNYVIHACLTWITENIAEPDPAVCRKDEGGKWKALPTHPLLSLLEVPNEDQDGWQMLSATAADYRVYGNAYLRKERDNLERVRELWWTPQHMISPVWDTDGRKFISHYVYRPTGHGTPIRLRKQDVIHFRWRGDSLTAGRMGVHRTQPVYRAIAALNEGDTYTPTLLRNMGIVPTLISVKEALTEDGKTALREWWAKLFTRDGRGKPGVMEKEGTVQQLGLSPEDMALDKILQRPELAVLAAFGIPAAVLGFGVVGGDKGLDNGGQHEQARKAAYHDCLMPTLSQFGHCLTRQLLPDFELDPTGLRVQWDFSQVPALREDQNALYERNNKAVLAGWLMVSEAREAAGKPFDESHNVFYRPNTVAAVMEPGEEVEPPEPPGGMPGEPEDEED